MRMPNFASMLLDLRLAVRQLRRSPGFALTGVLTLALAIGAACVMFTVVRSVLLEPLPYPEADRLVGLDLDAPPVSVADAQTGQSAQFLLDHARSFQSFGLADRGGEADENFASGNGSPLAVHALHISAGYLPTLGVPPLLGRSFTLAEDTPGSGRVVMLSEGLWRGALGGDPGVIGKVVRVNGDPATVVGVLPGSFAMVGSPELLQPLRISPHDPGYEGTNYELIARLRPGVTLAQARAELETLSPALLGTFPGLRNWNNGGPSVGFLAFPLQAVVAAEARPGIVMLSWAVLAVLVIACLNLAALMTARTATREAELALRSALGAGRGALLRLMLGESVLLATVGGLLGLVGAYVALPVLVHAAPLALPKLHGTTVGARTAMFALAAGFGATLLFGLLPGWTALRRAPGAGMASARTAGASGARQRLGRSLLVAQVTLATALLAVGSVLLGTFAKLRAATPGLRPEHLEVLQVHLRGERYTSAARTGQFIQAALDRLAAIPGVGSAAAVYGLPLDRGLNNAAGPADRPGLVKYAETRFVTPGYFATVGTPLVMGEDVSSAARAGTQPIALINEFAAQRWFASPAGALDRMIVDGGGAKSRVVGVVAPVHLGSLADAQAPTVYLPIAQMDERTAKTVNGWFPVSFALRVRPIAGGDPDVAHAAAAVISALDPDLAVSKFVPMQSFVEESYAAPRFFSWLAGGFAGFSLLLTVIGLFGLLSYQVASRTREIGVRMAVGASRTQIAGLILRRGLLLTAVGLAMGLGIAAALRSQLLGFAATTMGVSQGQAAAVLTRQTPARTVTAGLLRRPAAGAGVVPALRAAGVEPTEALRAE